MSSEAKTEAEFRVEWLKESHLAYKLWIDAWLSCGGTEVQLSVMLAQRDAYVRLYQSGPKGWGPVPEGCIETQDAKLVKNHNFHNFEFEIRKLINAWDRPLIVFLITLPFVSPLSCGDLYVVLPSLWRLESEITPRSEGALWWSRESAPSNTMLWQFYLKYCWGLGIPNCEPVPVLDRCLAAIASGRLPVGLDGDTVICYRIDPARMQKDIANEKRRRKGDNWPTFAPQGDAQ